MSRESPDFFASKSFCTDPVCSKAEGAPLLLDSCEGVENEGGSEALRLPCLDDDDLRGVLLGDGFDDRTPMARNARNDVWLRQVRAGAREL